jgi:hypothetical protein
MEVLPFTYLSLRRSLHVTTCWGVVNAGALERC